MTTHRREFILSMVAMALSGKANSSASTTRTGSRCTASRVIRRHIINPEELRELVTGWQERTFDLADLAF